MKVKTTKVITLTAKETGDILIGRLIDQVSQDSDGSLGKVLSGNAKDLDGLAAEVTLLFEAEVKA